MNKKIICQRLISLAKKSMHSSSHWGFYQQDVRQLKKEVQKKEK